MSSIVLDYSWLDDMKKSLSKAADQAQDYAQDLNKQYLNKTDDIPGGLSHELSDANYFVRQKITKLNDKAARLEKLAKQSEQLCAVAKRVDGQVEKLILQAKADFLEEHTSLKRPGWQEALINFFVDVKNSNWLFAMVSDFIGSIATVFTNLKENIRYWYECGGGRQVMSIVGAAVGLAVAVIMAICAFAALAAASGVIAFLVAVCGLVAATIGVFNAVFDLIQSHKMIDAYANGEQAWAKIYGDQDSVADWMRFTNFGSAELNQRMNRIAFSIEVTEFVCGVVNLVDNIVKVGLKLQAVSGILKEKGGLKSVWNGGHMTSDGFVLNVDVFKDGTYSSSKGFKALNNLWKVGSEQAELLNPKVFTSISSGMKTLKSYGKALDAGYKVYDLGFEHGLGTLTAFGAFTYLTEANDFFGDVDSLSLPSITSEYVFGYENTSDVIGSNLIHKGTSLWEKMTGWNRYQAAYELSTLVKNVPVGEFAPSEIAYSSFASQSVSSGAY